MGIRVFSLFTVFLLAGVLAEDFDEGEQAIIVSTHNRLRSTEANQESVEYMRKTKWNTDLQKEARSMTTSCKFEEPNKRSPRWSADFLSERIGYTGAMAKWYGHKSSYDYNTDKCTGSYPRYCSSYLNTVMAEGLDIGCSINFCDKLEGMALQSIYYFVCYYEEHARYEIYDNYKKPYSKGELCSKCQESNFDCIDNLCAPPKILPAL